MWDLLVVFGRLIVGLAISAFSVWKQLTGIQNDFWAAALGVSPFVATVFVFALNKLLKLLKSH